jgi:hypothetical protein
MRTKISWNDEKDGRGSIAAGSTMCATLAEFADVNDGDGSIFDRIVEQPGGNGDRVHLHRVDTYTIARALYRSLDNTIHLEVACYLRQRLGGLFVLH